MLDVTPLGYTVRPRVQQHPNQIVLCHGDPFADTEASSLGVQVRAATSFTGGLTATGYTVEQPWLGSNWATDIDAHSNGGHGISVIDTLFPSGMVDLIGWSMGGCNATVWASQHVERVASLTLISPAVDILAEWDFCDGNQILDDVAREIGTCISGDADATRATIAADLITRRLDIATITAALAPIANKIWMVGALTDPIIPVAMLDAFAAGVGIPDGQWSLPAGNSHHPAPYSPPFWEPLSTLRQVVAHG